AGIAGGIFYAVLKFDIFKQSPVQLSQNQQKVVLPISKLAYNSKGKAKIYDFRNGKEIDLGLSGVTTFLWSKNGQLAVLVQGKYGGDQGFLGIPRVLATTEGFNYLLYLVDLEGKKPKLILPEVFGEVFWSEDSTGFYVSENYRAGKPIISGEQSGLQPDEIKTYFVTLDGAKDSVDKQTFDQIAIKASKRVSPDNKYYIKSGDMSGFEKIVYIETGKDYVLKPGSFYTRTFNAKWSPKGDKIAFLYKVSDEATKNTIFNQVTMNDVLAQNFFDRLKGPLPSGESVDFDWIDNQRVIISQLNYISQPGYYQGNIGIYDTDSDKFQILISSIIQQVPYENMLTSPDRKFFAYQTSLKLAEEEIIIADLEGKEIKKLSGRDPSWEPIK
ncbi:MAG: hypothetical protein ABIC96_01165, partial [Patescibacteria group bacterium]